MYDGDYDYIETFNSELNEGVYEENTTTEDLDRFMDFDVDDMYGGEEI
jgi:hypothetical protein